MRRRRRRRRVNHFRSMACIAVVVGVLLISLMVQSRILKAKNAQYQVHVSDLEKQIRDEKKRTKEIEDLEEYMQSKEYAEEVAKDKLGLVYKDEIIFKEK